MCQYMPLLRDMKFVLHELLDAVGDREGAIAGRDSSRTHGDAFPMFANIDWNPSISVPAGVTTDGFPVGLLITVRRHCDDLALRLTRILETAAPWPLTAPGYS